MAVKHYACKSLSGNTVSDGIALKGKELWVHTDSEVGDVLAVSTTELDSVEVAAVGRHKETKRIILKPGEGEKVDESRELVLVKEYSPGCGGKRWPSFYIDWESCGDVEVLEKAYRTRHSGAEYYSLVFAPVGWAKNIASQFVNVKDYGGQTISYNPDFDPTADDNVVPREIKIAFGGDIDRAQEFIAKVAKLNAKKLDEHIVCSCGRARRRAHLEKASGDSNFFLGADPNSVCDYIAEVHGLGYHGGCEESEPAPQADFSKYSPSSEESGNDAMAAALRAAGLAK